VFVIDIRVYTVPFKSSPTIYKIGKISPSPNPDKSIFYKDTTLNNIGKKSDPF